MRIGIARGATFGSYYPGDLAALEANATLGGAFRGVRAADNARRISRNAALDDQYPLVAVENYDALYPTDSARFRSRVWPESEIAKIIPFFKVNGE